jgi:hypothetical protein
MRNPLRTKKSGTPMPNPKKRENPKLSLEKINCLLCRQNIINAAMALYPVKALKYWLFLMINIFISMEQKKASHFCEAFKK